MLIPLLQSLYNPNISFSHDIRDYDKALKDIELFSVSSQVYHLLKAKGRIEQVPAIFHNKLKAKYTQGIYQNLFMKHKEEEVLDIFERERLHVIPLKGIRFAETYFGHYTARLTSDIDLLIRSDRLHEVIACLESYGYVFEIIKDHHARMHKDGLMIELHWTLDKQQWSDLDTDPFWHSAGRLKNFNYVKELSPLHTFYFICLHGARHQMDSIRYVMDIVQILFSSDQTIDYEKLMEQTIVDKTSKRVKAVLSIVYQQFPHLLDVKPLPFKTFDTHWDYNIIRSARLGEKTKQYYLYKLYFRHFIFDTWKHQMNSINKAY